MSLINTTGWEDTVLASLDGDYASDVVDMARRLDAEIECLKSRVEELEGQLKDKEAELGAKAAKTERLEERVRDAEGSLTIAERRIEELTGAP